MKTGSGTFHKSVPPSPGLRLAGLVVTWLVFFLFSFTLAGAQTSSDRQDPDREDKGRQTPTVAGAEYSGMYTFLSDGEFVQINVEEKGRVTGFVSRYGDSESDRGVFLEHFFKSGQLDGGRLTFTTEVVHGLQFEFRGTVERGEGKKPGDEAYYVLKGTLLENSTDQAKTTSRQSRAVALKSFPHDLSLPEADQGGEKK
ncbi:MAG: hypothetical protein ABSD75_17605 [Terriglobales bacterium]|jgi:hypothetical protein